MFQPSGGAQGLAEDDEEKAFLIKEKARTARPPILTEDALVCLETCQKVQEFIDKHAATTTDDDFQMVLTRDTLSHLVSDEENEGIWAAFAFSLPDATKEM